MPAESPSPSGHLAVDVRGLRKSFGDHLVLDHIDLSVAQGSVFALLGPNGAGKTTVVNVLTTLLSADAGEITVLGHHRGRSPDAVRREIGVTGQFSAVDTLLTGRENLRLMADLHHLDRKLGSARIQDLLERFELVDAADKPAAVYSGGMTRRLDLAMTLVGTPTLLFLDEPTTGLDPRSRHTMWRIIRELVADGVTVFLTTQYLEEADRLADQIAVLDGGRIIAQGTCEELKQRVPGGHIQLRFDDVRQLELAAHAFEEATDRDDRALVLRVPSDGSMNSLRTVLDRLDRRDITARELSVHTPDLDDAFLALTGHDAPGTQP